jgi:glycosyltransferase involved in cell wall biosynthesis
VICAVVVAELTPARGVIESSVLGLMRALARAGLPGRVVFLEPARRAFGASARAALGRYRAAWPEGRLHLVPFSSRIAGLGPAALLAATLLRWSRPGRELALHCRGPRATLSAARVRRLFQRARVIFDLRGAYPYETIHRLGHRWADHLPDSARHAWQRALAVERSAAAAADAIVTVSEGLRRYAIERLDCSADKVQVVPSCVEACSFDPAPRRRARAGWGLADGELVLFYAGRLGPDRQPELMVRLLGRLQRRRAARLVVYSDRAGECDWPALLRAQGLGSDRVILGSGARDQVRELMCGGDVGVLLLESALRFDGLAAPIKVAEYLAAGLPLLVTPAVGSIPALLRERRIGWVVERLDDRSLDLLVDAIAGALAAEPEAIRNRALACCHELFLWERQVPALRRAYGRAAAETGT